MFKTDLEKIKKEIKEELKADFEKDIEGACFKIIADMFSDERDYKNEDLNWHTITVRTIGGDFKRRTFDAVMEGVNERCELEAKNVVNGEDFIDEIVQRIKKKQLK